MRAIDGWILVSLVESVEPNEDVSLEGFTSCNVSGFFPWSMCGN